MSDKKVFWKVSLILFIMLEIFLAYKIYADSQLIEINKEKKELIEKRIYQLKEKKKKEKIKLEEIKIEIKRRKEIRRLEEERILREKKERERRMQEKYTKEGVEVYIFGHRILKDSVYPPIEISEEFQSFFVLVKVEKDDNYAKLISKIFDINEKRITKEELLELINLSEKINRVGRFNLKREMKLVIPSSLKALKYSPFKNILSDTEIEEIDQKRKERVAQYWNDFGSDWGNKFFQKRASKAYSHILKISLKNQYFALYKNGMLIYWGPISSGNGELATPPGFYITLWQKKDWYSFKYEAPMPNAVNFATEGFFTHTGFLPGYPQSHGCLRMLDKDSSLIYQIALDEVFPIIVE